MVVAVDISSSSIGEQLRQKGYEVVSYGKYPYPIDALLYCGERLPNMEGMSLSSGVFDVDKPQGILIVNIANKTIEEIDQILKRRLYSPLF